MSQPNQGTVVQIIGPVLDIRFPADALPRLLNAITVTAPDGRVVTAEAAQHIGQDTVRCIAMQSTDGLVRGLPASDTGAPITVPVGRGNLGRIFNLLGEPVDHSRLYRIPPAGRSTARHPPTRNNSPGPRF